MERTLSSRCTTDACGHTKHTTCSAGAQPLTKSGNHSLPRLPSTLAGGRKSPSVLDCVKDPLDALVFRRAGMVQVDPQAAKNAASSAALTIVTRSPMRRKMLLSASAHARYPRRGGEDYLMVFNDGSVKLQETERLAHGG